jgi:spore maturation protein A
MLNKIWFWLLCLGILYAFAKASYQTAFPPPASQAASANKAQPEPTPLPPDAVETFRHGVSQALRSLLKLPPEPEPAKDEVGFAAMGKRLNTAALDAATTSVEICIGLIGIMALWLGLLRIAEDAGLVDAFARLLRPLMRWLFPEIPDGHTAQGAMLMNMSANMLGLDNAATPLGLKAMNELQELNPVKDTATNSMATFLAINNSSITIIPFTIIGYRALKGSHNAAAPLAGTLVVTTITTVAAVIAVRWLSRRPAYRMAAEGAQAGDAQAGSAIDAGESNG